MLWYEGSIAEAVNLSKERNAIFVVFVEDDNELSVEMRSMLEDGDVSKRLSNEANFLTVKLKSGSTDYTHFAQIYQFVPVPSMFFIGRAGTPLEVVCAGVRPDNLAARIDRILREHHKQYPPLQAGPSPQPSTSSQSIRQQTANLINEEAKNIPESKVPSADEGRLSSSAVETALTEAVEPSPITKTQHPRDEETADTSAGPATKVQKTDHTPVEPATQYEVVCTGDVCVRKPVVPGEAPLASTDPQSSDVDEEAKLKRTMELIEARRKEKLQQEKELERRNEIQRRQTGQGVAELRRWQQEQELKQIQEERKREKMEEQQARQRVLAQIAQDRAERRTPGPPAPAPAPGPPATLPTTSPGEAGVGGAGGGRGGARIQFKLSSGESHTAQFERGARLAAVRQYVADNLQLESGGFTLWTAFPRRELADDAMTLEHLELAPSAALLVLPRRSPTRDVTQAGRLDNLTTWLTQLFSSYVVLPSMHIWNFIRSRLFPGQGRPRARSEDRRPSPLTPGLRYRPRTNIHRLTGDASDDENNTWNGNSTQQM